MVCFLLTVLPLARAHLYPELSLITETSPVWTSTVAADESGSANCARDGASDSNSAAAMSSVAGGLPINVKRLSITTFVRQNKFSLAPNLQVQMGDLA